MEFQDEERSGNVTQIDNTTVSQIIEQQVIETNKDTPQIEEFDEDMPPLEPRPNEDENPVNETTDDF